MQRDPRNIKTGWKENLATFLTELKTLEASDMTTMGLALNAVFETLNINQMQRGIGPLPLLPVACCDCGGDGRGQAEHGQHSAEGADPAHDGGGSGRMSGVPVGQDDQGAL